jgi:hypothetical protein
VSLPLHPSLQSGESFTLETPPSFLNEPLPKKDIKLRDETVTMILLPDLEIENVLKSHAIGTDCILSEPFKMGEMGQFICRIFEAAHPI